MIGYRSILYGLRPQTFSKRLMNTIYTIWLYIYACTVAYIGGGVGELEPQKQNFMCVSVRALHGSICLRFQRRANKIYVQI